MDTAYEEGQTANMDGAYERDCPYSEGAPERDEWLRGFRDFASIRAEWEGENHDRARMYS
jgi:ribosome modulation factor